MIGPVEFMNALRDIICANVMVRPVGVFPHKNTTVAQVLEWSGIQQLVAVKNYLYHNASVFLERKKGRLDMIENRLNTSLATMSSRYRGVSKAKNGKFTASIYHDGKTHHLGTFSGEVTAASAYDQAAIGFGKPRYRLNLVTAV